MKIEWKVSRDKNRAILNGGDLEVEIKKINNFEDAAVQKLSKKYISKCGFVKIESGNIYDCIISINNMQNVFNNMDFEIAAKFIPKLWSRLGDIYEEN